MSTTPPLKPSRHPEPSTTSGSETTMSDQDLTLKIRPWLRRVTPWSDILAHDYKGSGTEAEPYVVTWLPQDVENPMTYQPVYKWSVTMLGEWVRWC